ncbi:MAG: NAD-dependent epimerase/dehydratase family protein [Candidatus Aenigmarchaeota archaeon]|nr:NAD-dependent epimerase/dehydratase family protein [Candidatus Aenigmarchaeota archaeon]
MNICITGGAGFIGSHLTNALIKENHSVTVVDNFTTGNAKYVNKDARIIKCDITDFASLQKFLNGFDVIFHLAAQTDVRVSQQNPDMDYQVNFSGTRNVADAVKDNGSKIIFSSSCAVYGNCDEPVPEESEARPLSKYALNKFQAEKLLPKNAFIARMFNVYGLRGNSFVNKACKAALKEGNIQIYGSGMQTRDYVHIDDTVAALIKGMNLKGTYNIGTGKESSVLSVVHMAESSSGSKIKTIFTDPVDGEIERSVADITKIEKEEWTPQISLADGIRQMCRAK